MGYIYGHTNPSDLFAMLVLDFFSKFGLYIFVFFLHFASKCVM